MLARHVSDLTGPSSGAFYKLYSQIWYVVIRVLLDTSSRYEVVGSAVVVLGYGRGNFSMGMPQRHTEGTEVQFQSFLTSALWGKWSASQPGSFTSK